MSSSLLRSTFCFVVLCLASWGQAQIQNDIEQQNIGKAEAFAVDLIAGIKELPPRWAARQRREVVNNFNLASSKFTVEKTEEIWASDDDSQTVFTRFSKGERKSDPSRPAEDSSIDDIDVLTSHNRNRIIQKSGPQPWTIVPKLQNLGTTSSHPYNWIFGGLNSMRLGHLFQSDYLSNKFFSQNRKCITAQVDKSGNLMACWGIVDSPKPYAYELVFSKTGLLVEHSLLKFSGPTTKESIAKRDFSRLEETKVQWKRFPAGGRGNKPINLPVRIEIHSVVNEGEELESSNEIVWKLGKKDVPNSLFVDPLKHEVVEPDFDK